MNNKEKMIERAEKLNRKLEGKDFRIRVNECFKNNGMKVSYTLFSEKTKVSPTLYFENMEEYWDDDEKLIEFLEKIHEENKDCIINTNEIISREYILSNVRPKLVSDSNMEDIISQKIVYRKFLDMLILYYVEVPVINGQDIASFTINDNNLRYVKENGPMDITENELYSYAIRNCRDDYSIRNMKDVISELLFGTNEQVLDIPGSDNEMLVVSNHKNFNGAAAMLDRTVLEKLSSMFGGDFVILPSSIHEFIALSAENLDKDELKIMVCEVNENEVREEDRLSDSVYIYSKGELNAY